MAHRWGIVIGMKDDVPIVIPYKPDCEDDELEDGETTGVAIVGMKGDVPVVARVRGLCDGEDLVEGNIYAGPIIGATESGVPIVMAQCRACLATGICCINSELDPVQVPHTVTATFTSACAAWNWEVVLDWDEASCDYKKTIVPADGIFPCTCSPAGLWEVVYSPFSSTRYLTVEYFADPDTDSCLGIPSGTILRAKWFTAAGVGQPCTEGWPIDFDQTSSSSSTCGVGVSCVLGYCACGGGFGLQAVRVVVS